MAAASQPTLSVDVNLAQNQGRHPRQANRALMHAARSVQAPFDGDQGGFSSDDEDDVNTRTAQSRHLFSRDQAARRREAASIDDDYALHTNNNQYHVELEGVHGQGMHNNVGEEDEGEGEDEDEDGDEDEEEMDADEDDDLSSSPSIPDENIDFDLVYALHTFVATVEGQATVNKGNSLTLLDDSNSYW